MERELHNKASQLAERHALWSGRVSDRVKSFKGDVIIPDSFDSMRASEEWIAGLKPEDRKLVLMTNREFRALQGTKPTTSSEVVG
jgi:hypothetical protein